MVFALLLQLTTSSSDIAIDGADWGRVDLKAEEYAEEYVLFMTSVYARCAHGRRLGDSKQKSLCTDILPARSQTIVVG